MHKRIAVTTGMPRSGTSWIGQIIDSSPDVRYLMAPLFSYEFKNALGHGASREQWQELLEQAYQSDDEYLNSTHRRRSGDYPTFENKQEAPPVLVCKFDRFQDLMPEMLELFPDMKMAGVVRHPCGAVHSWLTAPKEFPPDADPLLEWRTGSCKKSEFGDRFGFDDWLYVARMFDKLATSHPTQFRIIRYERFVEDALGETEKLFRFFDLELGEQTRAFIDASQSTVVDRTYSVFKPASVKDRWRTELQPEIANAIIDELTGTEFERYLE